jgi:hypothetical protein
MEGAAPRIVNDSRAACGLHKGPGMRRPRWTLLHASVFSAAIIACSDDPADGPNPKETPAQKIDRQTDRGAVDVDDDARREDRSVRSDAPREPGADARDTPRERLDKAGNEIDESFDRAGEKIENAANKTADGIDRAAKKTSDKLRTDDDAPREPGSER